MINISHEKFGPKVISSDGDVDFLSPGLSYDDTKIEVIEPSKSYTKALLDYILEGILDEYKLYFIFTEGAPNIKSKMRSHKKMFYKFVKSKSLSKNDLYEYEIDLQNQLSIIVAIINVSDKETLDFVLENLLNQNLSFIYLVKNGKRSFKENRAVFSQNVLASKLDDLNSVVVDPVKLAANIVRKNNGLIKVRFSGKDKNSIDVITKSQSKGIQDSIVRLANVYRSMVLN